MTISVPTDSLTIEKLAWVSFIKLNKIGNNTGKPSTAVNTALLSVLFAIAEMNVKTIPRPRLPSKTAIKNKS